jgi:hypothetical protein
MRVNLYLINRKKTEIREIFSIKRLLLFQAKLKSNDECHAIADITKYVYDLQQRGHQAPNDRISYELSNFVTSTTKPDLLPLFDAEETNDLNYLFILTCNRIARNQLQIK